MDLPNRNPNPNRNPAFLVNAGGSHMQNHGSTVFNHERLEVCRAAILFIAWVSDLLADAEKVGDVKVQLDRAATSIALNIAEGNGKYAAKDRCRFFDIAHGCALECAAGLDVLVAKARFTDAEIREGKQSLLRIVRLLIGLIKSNSVREYRRREEKDRGHDDRQWSE